MISFEDLSITESVKRSADLFRRQWGTQVVSGFSLGLIFFVLAIPGFFLGVLGFVVHSAVGIAVMVIYFLMLAAVASAVRGIFTVALYRFATTGEVPAGFSPELAERAFAPKRSW